jgi:hypothetical protein
MKTSFVAAVSLLFFLLLASLPILGQNGPTLTAKPVVTWDDHHDVSPPLRTIPKFKPSKSERLRKYNEEQEEENQRHPEAITAAAMVEDPVVQSAPAISPSVAVTASRNFDGIGNGIAGFSAGGAPPDTNGAVGLTQYVQAVNASFAVFDKNTGALELGPEDFRTLYTGFGGLCETNGGSDPVVLYDKLANRWILSILVSSNAVNFECFAVSTSPDATGSYNRYAIPFGRFLNDFPKLGVWPDAYYFSGNEFDQINGGLTDRNFCAIDRTSSLSGAPLQMICFKIATSQTSGSVLPADMDGATPPSPGEPNFFIGLGLGPGFATLRMFKFHVDFTTPANSQISAPIDIPVAAFTRLCPGNHCIPQPTTTQLLDSIGDVPNFRVAYRNFGDHEAIVLNHSVQTASSSGVRWYEIRDPNGTPTVFQQGTFAPDANWRWMAGIAIDKAGDIAVGYSLSSSTVRPSLGIAARLPSDPAGTLGPETVAFSGAGSQTTTLNRWGDYSAMTVDPEDDCTFWYTNEYIPTNGTFNWRTRIVSFSVPGCVTTPVAALNPTSVPFAEQAVGTSSSPQAVQLTNNGPGDLTINGITASGDFSETDNCVSPLTAGTSCTINVTFSPTAAGTRSGVLTVTDNSGNGPHIAPLTGTGISASNGATVVNFSSGFSGATNLTLNGGAAINGALLRITDGSANEARSAFFNTAQPVEFFTTDFTFRLTNAVADGFTFTLQGNSPTSVGPGGSGLGYGGNTGGIPNSVAVKFDLANSQGEGSNSTGVYTNGASPTVPATTLVPFGINLHTGDLFYVHMTYDGNNLAWTITDSNTGKNFSGSVPVNVPGNVGAVSGTPNAFVGFTGGTGGSTAIQDILTWSFQTPGITAPFVSLSPASLAFGYQSTGATTAAQTVTVTNNGPGAAAVTNIMTSGDFAQTNNCPASLDAGTSCTVNVTFTPAAAGARLGTLLVSDAAFNGAQTASLIGIGLDPNIPVPADFRNGFATPTGLTLNGGAAIAGTRLRLTDGGTSEARSAFFSPPVNIQSFTSDFIFQLTNATADGFTFTIQRSALTAIGAGGGGLAYGNSSATGFGGIPNSIAIKFGIFNSNSTGLLTNGAFPGSTSTDMTGSGINLHTGHIFYVHVTYDGTTLTWTVVDSVSGALFSTSKPIDIPGTIGGTAAFVGFTGASGGSTAIQDILAWTFQTPGTISSYATASPASIVFGTQTVGTTSAAQSVTLTNNGPGTTNISGILISGDYAQTNTCGPTLDPGNSCTINVSFAPASSGPRIGRLTINDDAAIAPQTVSLCGIGTANGAALTVNFGCGFPNSTGLTLNGGASVPSLSGRLRLTDGNTGEARSAFTTVAVNASSFVNDFLFQLTNPSADGFTFAVQNKANTAVGASGGGLGYGNSSPTGTGGIPTSVAVKFDLFTNISPNGESNNGTGIYTNGAFPGLPDFDLTPSGISLHSGHIFAVHMTYDGANLAWTITDTVTGKSFSTSAAINIPGTVGAQTAFVGFTGGTGGLTATQDILAWTYQTDASAPVALASPTSLTFSGQTVGTSSPSQPITLTNNGPGSLTINSISASGDFSETDNCVSPLAASSSCTINITFTPTATGTRSGMLTVSDSAFITPQTVPLSGAGLQDATTTTLVSSLPTSTFGQPVTFTATLTPATPTSAPAPTGTISFTDGTTTLATVAVAANTASFTTSSLTAGSHGITATYSGDPLYSGSASAAFVQTVNQATPVITWNTPAPITYGTPLDVSQLNAAANVPGTLAYSPAAGTVLNAGTQTLSVTFTPADALDYTNAGATVSLTVNPAPLTVTAANANRQYGQANPAFTGTITGLQNGDNITASYSTVADPTSPVGTYAIVPALVDPDNKLSNYSVTPSNGTLTITPAPLTVTADNASRQYGQSNPTFTGAVTGIQNGDNITASYSTVADPTSPVGTYAIVPALVDPDNKLGNYSVTTNNGTLTVTAAPLVVTAADAIRQYGQANPAFSGTITGIQNGDNITATYATSAMASSPVGTYAIVPAPVDPNNKLGNYAVTLNNGTLTVTQAPLSATANNKTRAYGQLNPQFDGTLTGVLNNDNITLTFATSATQTSPVGAYAIAPVLLDPDSKLGNYSATMNNGTLTIDPVPLVITADDATKLLDAPNPVFTATYTGFVLGEEPDVLTGTLVCTTTAVTDSPVGTYPITCSGQSSTNYSITYVPGTLTVIFSTGSCNGAPGHAILPPIAANGKGIFNFTRAVPATFRVCDANGVSVGAAGIVRSFNIIQIITGTGSQTVNLPVPSKTQNSAFLFDQNNQEWVFEIDDSKLAPISTYVFRIVLSDGSNIDFRFGVRRGFRHDER